jgi:hypothetical protein
MFDGSRLIFSRLVESSTIFYIYLHFNSSIITSAHHMRRLMSLDFHSSTYPHLHCICPGRIVADTPVLYCTVLCCTVLCCSVLTVTYYIGLYRTALLCTFMSTCHGEQRHINVHSPGIIIKYHTRRQESTFHLSDQK